MRLVIAFRPAVRGSGGPCPADQLGKELAVGVIVEKSNSANGNIAAAHASKVAPTVRAAPDERGRGGHQSGALQGPVSYDPRGFCAGPRVVNNATVFVVNPSNPATDAADFVKRSQAAANVAIGSSGIGSIPHRRWRCSPTPARPEVLHAVQGRRARDRMTCWAIRWPVLWRRPG